MLFQLGLVRQNPVQTAAEGYRTCSFDCKASSQFREFYLNSMGDKRVGLHHIAFSEYRDCKDKTGRVFTFKNRSIQWWRDELRLDAEPPETTERLALGLGIRTQ
jgi:hypothetical protein